MNAMLVSQLQPFAIALAIGLLLGIERERSHPPGYQALGLRSFVLLSLLGATIAQLQDPLLTATVTFFVGVAIIAGYLRSSRRRANDPDIGITTEIAAMITYILGFLAFKNALISLLLGVVVLVILMSRTPLHRFSRNQLRPEELQATATILVLGLGIITFLPDETIDPWHLFNPFRFGILVFIIALLQFAAYAGIRIFGTHKGVLLSGFLAGFVSSTAATATLTQRAGKKSAPLLVTSAAVMLATVAMFIELMVIIGVVAPKLLVMTGLPLVIPAFLMFLVALGIGKYFDTENHYPAPDNPLALTSAVKMALFLAIMLLIVTLSERMLGGVGTRIVIFLAGLVQMRGAALAVSSLYAHGQITALQATVDLGIAVIASFISKYFIVWFISPNRYAVICSLLMTAMLGVFVMIWLQAIL